MEKNKARKYFTVINKKGLHTRPSTELVKCASKFKSEIYLIYLHHKINAKSLLGILMLAAIRGAKIIVEAEGEDAELAVNTIVYLAKHNFNIHY